MADSLDLFEDYLLENEKSSNTAKSYASDVKKLLEYLNKDISEITQKDLIEYKKQMVEKGNKALTRNRNLSAIRKYIEFINISQDAAIDIKIKKEKVQKQHYLREMLSKTDYRRMLGVAERDHDHRAVALFEIMYLTGMRISEALQFKLRDLEKSKITVVGKGNKEREVILPDKLVETLKAYAGVRNRTSTDRLFTTRRGPMDRRTADKIIKKYGSLAKVKRSKCHAHNFRHLFAIICLVERGMTIDVVADLLGHEDINVTRIYTRMTQEELMKIVQSFE